MKRDIQKCSRALLQRGLLVLCVLAILTSGLIYAKEKRTVKVAFFPMDGYHIRLEDGGYGGMDVDYLKILCHYAPWDIEYVVCESWDDALKKLENHEVDLVGSAQ